MTRTLQALEAYLAEEGRRVDEGFQRAEGMPHGEERQTVWQRARHAHRELGENRHSLRYIKGDQAPIFEKYWARGDREGLRFWGVGWVLDLPLEGGGGGPSSLALRGQNLPFSRYKSSEGSPALLGALLSKTTVVLEAGQATEG